MKRTRQTPTQIAQRIIAAYPQELRECRNALLNFDVPAQRTINWFFSRIGVNRFPGGKDDVWEAIMAIDSGTAYEAPPKRLIERWMAY